MAVIHSGVKVSGMELVRVLHGCIVNGELEAVCMKSFPSEYDGCLEVYSMRDDIANSLWNDVTIGCWSLLTWQLCHQALSQGVSFSSKRSPPLQLDRWKWNWLIDKLRAQDGSIVVHSFSQHGRKQLVVRQGVVHVYSLHINSQLIHGRRRHLEIVAACQHWSHSMLSLRHVCDFFSRRR